MKIEINEELGAVVIDGEIICASVLAEILNPDKRLLYRFYRENGLLKVRCFSEDSVIWLDLNELPPTEADIGQCESD